MKSKKNIKYMLTMLMRMIIIIIKLLLDLLLFKTKVA